MSAAYATALEFAQHGHRVLPIRGKVPLVGDGGFHQASTDPKQLLAWHGRWPNAGWAVVCGEGFSVVDVDPKHGGDVQEVILLVGGPMVETGQVNGHGRGLHVYVASDEPTGHTELQGVEIKGRGGYVVIPGSPHHSGVAYEWVRDTRPWTPGAMVPLPAALAPRRREQVIVDEGGRIPEHKRDVTLTSLAGTMRGRGMTAEVIHDALVSANAKMCDPPLGASQVAKIARSAGTWPLPVSDDNGRPALGPGKVTLGVRGVDLSAVEPVRFAWKPFLVAGALNLAVGEEGIGKSTFQALVAALMTTGGLQGVHRGAGADVLFIGADEDDWNQTVVPRLHASGADLDRVRELYEASGGPFNVVDHIGDLDRILGEYHYGLVIVEQIMDVLPSMRNPNDPSAMRQALKPLVRVLRKHSIAGLGTLHVNKGEATSFRQMQQGSVQYGAVSRSSFLIAAHPSDPTRRLVVMGKANYSKKEAVSFELAERLFTLNDHLFEMTVADDLLPEDMDMGDVLSPKTAARQVERDERVDAVWDALSEEPISEREVSRRSGVSRSTTQRILDKLVHEERAAKVPGGWVAQWPTPIGTGPVGHPPTLQLVMPDAEPLCDDCGGLLTNVNGQLVCYSPGCAR